ncbi:hypothetical protein PFISCL1PPCAC_6801 [Pristionchus fissidentatus]|uniref:BRCA1-associated protein n=1 Tax=Pristionchus fissidentatus TaxID=1538716 RepID=A0AAV5VCC7_9BILA|nr:hypothetical protein PFISCL1PPCAC_6801 [Pristionchus fissidentatus]
MTSVVIRLEVRKGSPTIDFSDLAYEMAESTRAGSEPTSVKSLPLPQKSCSPPTGCSREDAPLGRPSSRSGEMKRNYRGARTYSEVVVESYDRKEQGGTSKADPKYLTFLSGNKRVEKTEGILHFYKRSTPRIDGIRMVCMLNISVHLSCQDILNFFSTALPSIETIKVIRDETPGKYMMLILFKSSEDAELFYSDFNDQQYNALEQDRAILLFVETMDVLDESAVPDLVELPTCAVCLERMDDGVITIFCRHSFHAVCIQKCTDTICPICRCTQTPEAAAKQRCSACDESTDLWICLICGNVACGRYREAHAFRHFEETSHTFAQEVGGNRVWDYAGDNYVHRLIQAEQDGKLVAVERGGEETDEKAKASQVEAVTLEYTCLLTNQLERQRSYYEGELSKSERARSNLEKMALAQLEDVEAQLKRAVDECNKVRDELENSQKARTTAEKKQQSAITKMNKLSSDLAEERSLNSIVRSDQEKWHKQVEALQKDSSEMKEKYDREVTELKEQIRDLMLHLGGEADLERQAQEAGVTREEMEQGILEVGPQSEKKKQRRKSNKK